MSDNGLDSQLDNSLFVPQYEEKFKVRALQILEELNRGTPANLIEGYLSRGENAVAFNFEYEGEEYVIRIATEKNLGFRAVRTRLAVESLMRSVGIEKTAQLSGFSIESGVIVTKKLPGADLRDLIGKYQFTQTDYLDLIESLIRIDAKGLSIDGSPGNFIYREGYGFSLLDLHIQDRDRNIFHQLCDLPFIFLQQYPANIDFLEYLKITFDIIKILKESFPDLFNFVINENAKAIATGAFGIVYNMDDLITIENAEEVQKIMKSIEDTGISILKD